jgi:hypothetical protein
MSTTLIPPAFYVVKPRGRPVRAYATVKDAANALVLLGSLPATVGAITDEELAAEKAQVMNNGT